MRICAKWFFPLVQFVILVVLLVNELYPEMHLVVRLRNWISWTFLGPQPEPPDMPYAAEGRFQTIETTQPLV